jgi:transmembrane sensor
MKTDPNEFDRSIDAEASQWVTHERVGMDEAEKRRLADWLGARPEHRVAYDRLRSMAAVFQRVRTQNAATSIITELDARSRKRRKRRRAVVFGGAALMALAFGFYLRPIFIRLAGASENPSAQFEPIRRLPDGSIVELKEGAEITVEFDSAFRRVALVRGEALFRVEHDLDRPFIVSTRGVEVRAVGTAFNVKIESATVEVLVTEGKVRVDDSVRGVSLLPHGPERDALPATGVIEPVLIAGQEAVVNIENPTGGAPARVIQVGSDEIKRTLAWRIPHFDFDGVELANAVQKINRMNRVQIILADDSLSKLRLSGTFSPDDPETFSRLVAATFGLKAQRSGGVIVLSRE